jgi:predicted ATP-dependent endonuclease of OLD family
MKIIRIEINGFKSQNNTALVDFSSDQVSVIFGQNGSGKTTYLRAITAFLAQDERVLNDIGVNSVNFHYEDKGRLRSVFVLRQEDGYRWDEFNESSLKGATSLSLGVERGISTQTLKIDPGVIFRFFSNPRYRRLLNNNSKDQMSIRELCDDLSDYLRRRQVISRGRPSETNSEVQHMYLQNIKMENVEEVLVNQYKIARIVATRKIQSALFDTLALAISSVEQSLPDEDLFQDDLYSQLEENKERIIEALDDGSDNNFKHKVMEILGSLNDTGTYERIQSSGLLKSLLINILKELQVEKLMLNSINDLIERFNSFLIDGKKLMVNDERACISLGNTKHSINELSSGERHMLTFLSLVLFSGIERDFLIIDEPEISLNISWQHELLDLFSKLVPTTQIIVASHSPALVGNNPNYLCELQMNRSGIWA